MAARGRKRSESVSSGSPLMARSDLRPPTTPQGATRRSLESLTPSTSNACVTSTALDESKSTCPTRNRGLGSAPTPRMKPTSDQDGSARAGAAGDDASAIKEASSENVHELRDSKMSGLDECEAGPCAVAAVRTAEAAQPAALSRDVIADSTAAANTDAPFERATSRAADMAPRGVEVEPPSADDEDTAWQDLLRLVTSRVASAWSRPESPSSGVTTTATQAKDTASARATVTFVGDGNKASQALQGGTRSDAERGSGAGTAMGWESPGYRKRRSMGRLRPDM
ncbi:hypothetical protein HK101_004098 [Irineochytrium annulatum]|nr:hypothetical protein HK101_004098 [Irineochytrium annulatum]